MTVTDRAAVSNENGNQTAQPGNQQAVIAPDLLELLVCPVDHAKLNLVGETLVCTSCNRVFPIEQGIPNMIVNEEV